MGCNAALLAVVVAFSSASALSSTIWEDFLRRPDAMSAAQLTGALRTQISHRCDPIVVPSSEQVSALTKLVVKGGDAALILTAFLATRCLDGGNFEDVYRSLGRRLANLPDDVFRALEQEEVSEEELTYLTTMLPLELVDDPAAQLSEVDRRIVSIARVNDRTANRLRERALALLAQERRRLAAALAKTSGR
jgi:hypothetical protein